MHSTGIHHIAACKPLAIRHRVHLVDTCGYDVRRPVQACACSEAPRGRLVQLTFETYYLLAVAVHDWARQQSQTRQDRYSERGRHHRDPREYRERERDRTPSQRGHARDPRERYPSRSRSRYEADYRDSREGPMSRSASHTSLASFGPGNPNPYASKPKQRVRPKAPEPAKRAPAALASPEAVKKTDVKDGGPFSLLMHS